MGYVSECMEMKFKDGDKVRITHSALTRTQGWQNAWNPDMNEAIGKVGVISLTHDVCNVKGILVVIKGMHAFAYPFFVLQKVRPSNEERMQIRMKELHADT